MKRSEAIRQFEQWTLENYETVVRKVTAGNGDRLGSQEAVQDTFVKAVMVFQSTPEGELADVLEKWTSHRWYIEVAHNSWLDQHRRSKKLTTVSPLSPEPNSDAPAESTLSNESGDDTLNELGTSDPVPDDVPYMMYRVERIRCVRRVVGALVQRGQVQPRAATRLTQRQFQILNLLFPLWEDVSDAVSPRHRKRRDDPPIRRGLLTEVAKGLGISPSAVTQSKNQSSAMIQVTIYVAGVLAPEKALSDVKKISTRLVAFDGMVARGHREEHALLTAAAPSVRTMPGKGTRVSVEQFTSSCNEQLDTLHAAESLHGRNTHTSTINCVTICPDHNPTPDREIEIA